MRKKSLDLIFTLEEELSILNEPGEYESLPLAVVADELSLSLSQVKRMVLLGEIIATGKSPHQRVSRAELEHAGSIGVGGLLQRVEEDVTTIF